MSLNPLNNISAVYIAEVLKPQLGQNKPEAKSSPESGAGAGAEGGGSEKRIRQAVYDIRYRARREDIPLDQAFNQYMSHTSMNAVEKDAVKAKLGMTSGSAVKEEVVDEALSGHHEKKFQVRVKDKLSGRSYVRSASRSKIAKLRSNPNISSVEMTKYGTPYEGEKRGGKQTAKVAAGKGLDPVGHEDKDIDNDGDHDKTDKYLLNRRKVRGAAIAKKNVKEGFSNWREDLREVVDDEISAEKKSEVKEKKVNNKITINPKLSEEVQLLESVELSEDYLFETINIAAEYFCEHGLNEDGVNILIENLGLDDFASFVFEIREEDLLTEARAGGVKVSPTTKGGKPVSQLKGGARTAAINRLRKEKAARKEAESKASESKPSGFKSFSQRHAAVQTAKKQQPKKKGVLDRVAGAVLKGMERHKAATTAASQAFKKGMERHKAATSTASKLASQTAQTAKKAAGKVGGVAKEVGSGASAATKLTKRLATKGLGEEIDIQEVSPPGAKYERMVKHVKKGYSEDGLTKKEKEIAYATAWKQYNKMKNEALDPKIQDQPTSADDKVRSTQSDAVKKQQLQNLKMIQQKQQMLQRQKLQMQKGGKLPLENSYEPEGEVIDERRREDKGTPRPADPSPAFKAISKMMGSGRLGVQPRGKKKVRGQKPPAAGEYGAPASPAQKIAKRRAAEKRSQEMQSSRYD